MTTNNNGWIGDLYRFSANELQQLQQLQNLQSRYNMAIGTAIAPIPSPLLQAPFESQYAKLLEPNWPVPFWANVQPAPVAPKEPEIDYLSITRALAYGE